MAQLPGEARRAQYIASALQTVFIYDFVVYKEDEITVQQNDNTLTLTTEYTVQDAGETAGGTITLVTGATAGDIITITGNTMIERETTFTTGGDFLASAINAEFDRLDNINKEVISSQGDNFRLAVYNDDVSKTIPSPTARKTLVWNTAGTALENSVYDPDTQSDLAAAQVVLCEAETAKCIVQVGLASGYADDASGYANDALGYANDASGYATDASNSADEAAASAASVDFSAVASDILPDVSSTRLLGSSTKKWQNIYTNQINNGGNSIMHNVYPSTTNTYTSGTATNYWSNTFTTNLTCSTINSAAIPVPITSAQFNYTASGSTGGGTYNAYNLATRPINSEVYNDITGCSLASNQITLTVAGTYDFEYTFCSSEISDVKGYIYKISPATAGVQAQAIGSPVVGTYNTITTDFARLTITETTVYEIQMSGNTSKSTTGMGAPIAGDEDYLKLKITKVA